MKIWTAAGGVKQVARAGAVPGLDLDPLHERTFARSGADHEEAGAAPESELPAAAWPDAPLHAESAGAPPWAAPSFVPLTKPAISAQPVALQVGHHRPPRGKLRGLDEVAVRIVLLRQGPVPICARRREHHHRD